MENVKQSNTPVRIHMVSYRYEVSESLFETILSSAMDLRGMPPEDPMPVSPEEELMMGIMSDDASDSGYFVKPADPNMTEAVRHTPDGENEGFEKIELFSEGLLVYTPDGEDAQISLAYDESELAGMEGAHSVLTDFWSAR